MLLDNFYSIESHTTDEATNTHLFGIKLNPNHCIYNGHFPQRPVTPGVCSIQIIKECIEQVIGSELIIKQMAQCKMPSMITPDQTPNLTLSLQIKESDEGFQASAKLSHLETDCIIFKATLVKE